MASTRFLALLTFIAVTVAQTTDEVADAPEDFTSAPSTTPAPFSSAPATPSPPDVSTYSLSCGLTGVTADDAVTMGREMEKGLQEKAGDDSSVVLDAICTEDVDEEGWVEKECPYNRTSNAMARAFNLLAIDMSQPRTWEIIYSIATEKSPEEVQSTVVDSVREVVSQAAAAANITNATFSGVTVTVVSTPAPQTTEPSTEGPATSAPPEVTPSPPVTAAPITFRSLRLTFQVDSSVSSTLTALTADTNNLIEMLSSVLVATRSIIFISLCVESSCFYVFETSSDSEAMRMAEVLATTTAWTFVFDIDSDMSDSAMREAVVSAQGSLSGVIGELVTLNEVTVGEFSDTNSGDDDVAPGAIAGIVVGSLVFVGILAALAFTFAKQGFSPAHPEPEQEDPENLNAPY